MPVTVIDLQPAPEQLAAGVSWLQGDGTGAQALELAGVRQAAGIIAATSSDIDNLSACYTARELNPGLFTIVRQNGVANQPLFERFHADLTMVPREVIAHECLAILTTPMLAPFLQTVQAQPQDWCEALLQRLTQRLGWEAPEVWSVRISAREAPALHLRLNRGQRVRLGELLRDHADRSETLLCEVLQLDRSGQDLLLPAADSALEQGDELLFAGSRRARARLELVLRNDHALDYVLSGRESSGWLWQKLRA
jgi:Trk K+ transport system NAD-binding subunit